MRSPFFGSSLFSILRICTSISCPTDEKILRVRDALKPELGDVEHALEAAEVDERAVVLERGDPPLDHGTDGERAAQLGRARRLLLLEERAPRHDDVGAAAGRFVAGDAPAQLLPDEGAGVLGVAQIELRDGAERAHAADADLDAALVDAR